MKIEDTFTVEVDGASFEFKHPEYDDLIMVRDETDTVKRISHIFSKLLSVKGLEDSKGPVTAERAKTLKLPAYVVNQILNAHSKKVLDTMGVAKDADPKKPSSGTTA